MIFWTATPKLWVVSFTIFSPLPLYKAKSWKTQNTVFGYKKWLKFESDRIFWSATPTLWLFSFTIFSQRPLCKAKCWKTQNTVFDYNKWWKNESDRIFWSATPTLWVVSFATFFSKWPEHTSSGGVQWVAIFLMCGVTPSAWNLQYSAHCSWYEQLFELLDHLGFQNVF